MTTPNEEYRSALVDELMTLLDEVVATAQRHGRGVGTMRAMAADVIDAMMEAREREASLVEDRVVIEMLCPEGASPPTYAYGNDSGADLCSATEVNIMPNARALVATGVQVSIPKGYEGQIRPRSGLALRDGLTVLNSPGTVDSGYIGELKVILYNTSSYEVHLSKGTRIAQFVVAKVYRARFERVDSLDKTERGDEGFGSTGQ